MQHSTLTRRDLLLGAVTMTPVIHSIRSSWIGSSIRHHFARADDSTDSSIAAIERRVGGRLGVAALDTGSGERIEYRADERFAMCSTFKFLAVAAILKCVDDNKDELSRTVSYSKSDILDYAPITRQHLEEGGMTLSALCAAAIEYSDNTAGNLLLQALGGPTAVTHFARSISDSVTRLARNEPTLNTALPGDERDTTSPRVMIGDMRKILLGHALSISSREQLTSWLVGNTTGATRLRAGVPPTWRVGDKTGSGDRGAANDVAIMWRPARHPILVAAYLNETGASQEERNAALRDVGRVIAAWVREFPRSTREAQPRASASQGSR